MSSLRALKALEILELILAVQATRSAGDPFFLTTSLFNETHSRKSTLAARIAAASLAEGDRSGASGICRACLDVLEKSHRVGWRYLNGLLPDSIPVAAGDPPNISDPLRLQQFNRYGFVGGDCGDFTDDRVEELARLVPIAAATPVDNPGWHYPQPLVDHFAAHYATLQAHQALATGGLRTEAVQRVDEATDAAEIIIARVRGFYISASDEGDQTQQLKRIGLQPRRDAGQGSSGVVPDAPADATLDAAAKTLTIPTLPANANSIHCYRQRVAAGATPAGPVELAGISVSPTVSYVQLSPLAPGVDYEVWVVGYDGTDEGSPGNRIAVRG